MEELLSNPELTNPHYYWEFFASQFQTNDVFTGILVLSVAGSLMYSLRGLPLKIWNFLVRQFSVEMKIHNDDPLFESMKVFLSQTKYVKSRCRRLALASPKKHSSPELSYYGEKDSDHLPPFTLTPMDGFHWFFYRKNLVLYNRTIDEQKGPQRKETIHLRYLGRSRNLIYQMITDIQKMEESEKNNYKVYTAFRNYWQYAGRKIKRPLGTVYIDDEIKSYIIDDINWFYENPDWYAQRGIPYHRGYLFSGLPGTGKTSLIKAICSELDKTLGIINLNSVEGDDGLMEIVTEIPDNAILLIEDIDACLASHSRKVKKSKNKKSDDETAVTLSGLLNALDGIMTPDNQIIIMTTNHPEKLDEALMRNGRVDIHIDFPEMGAEMVERMFIGFFPEYANKAKKVAKKLTKDGEVIPAKIQGMFFEYAKDPEEFIKLVLKKK